jgi:putative transcriptional regulator
MLNTFITNTSDPEVLAEVGVRLRVLRKGRDLTIDDAARRSGLDRGTVSRAERGENPTLLTVIRLLRTYGRLGALAAFIPEPDVSPMDLIRRGRSGGHG